MRDVESPPDEGFPDVRPDDPEVQTLFLRRLRGRYPEETAGIDADRLTEIVRNGLKRCPPLMIRDPRDVLRFLALGVLITPEQKKSKLLEAVLRRVLEAVEDWSATKRMDFIYKHIVGRPPPNPEPDFGPWFVEAPA
jgi:hypothetical protein